MVKHFKNNNFKKGIFQKRSLRSTVYSYDDYDHVPSQEASSYLDSAELQSLSSLHYFFPPEYLSCDNYYRRQAY